MGLFSFLTELFEPAPKKVFISYQHRYDRRYRDLLCAWDANEHFAFTLERCSPTVAINSREAPRIKAALTHMLKQADYLLVIVGRRTHLSPWVRWEINRAKRADVNLRLVVVKLDNAYITPRALLRSGAVFARSFTLHAITRALEQA